MASDTGDFLERNYLRVDASARLSGEPEWSPPAPRTPATLNVPDVAGRELRLSAAEQEELFNRYVDVAIERAARQLTDPSLRRVVARSARSRMLANVDTFGDELWFKHPDVLMVDSIEELADAVVYLAARLYRRRNGPGTRG